MRRGRALLVLIAIPALVSLGMTLLVLTFMDSQRLQSPQVIILPTYSGTSQIAPRSTLAEGGATPAEVGQADQSQTSPTNGGPCQNPVHVVTSGETLSTIAAQYGLPADDLTSINQLIDPNFDPDLLSVGQQLVIPECGLPTQAPTTPPTNTPVATPNIPTPIATATEVPPGTVSVRITHVLNPGDITREAVSILNEGSPVEFKGWKISSGKSKDFVFPAFKLFTGGSVTVFSGVGENNFTNLYWGLNQAIWRLGDTVTLSDDTGTQRAQYTVAP
jgi:LysM repeat protein